MSEKNFFYVKLSCPKEDDDNKFLNLFQNLSLLESFNYNLTNIPNNLNTANPGDIVFILISGDISHKRNYFKNSPQFIEYNNGLHGAGEIKNINIDKKEVEVNLIGIKEIITREDLYFFPQFINNLGATTKGSPNQAGLYELDFDTALALLDYLNIRKLFPQDFNLFSDLNYINKLYSNALNAYNENFKQNKINQKVFEKLSNNIQKINECNSDYIIIDAFIQWFNNPINFKKSYQGIVNKENLQFWNQTYFNNKLFKIYGETKEEAFENIKNIVNHNDNLNWENFNLSTSKGAPKAVLGNNNYLKFIKEYIDNNSINLSSNLEPLDSIHFHEICANAGLSYPSQLITRYIASLATKPFVLLSGLSGSGKTKLAQAFAQWISEDSSQYCIVPVGADWTNREPLLGYVNALDNSEYILPENGALKLLIEANKKENANKPYFLILDEMNLSHVERYFADFLSIMESKDQFKLHSSEQNLNIKKTDLFTETVEVPNAIGWPKNLFIIGTVNIDETTYMFSPKVLDRANVIEFRVNKDDIEAFLQSPNEIDFTYLNGAGALMGKDFLQLASNKYFPEIDTNALNKKLVEFFEELKKTGAEFGYRSATEIHRLYNLLSALDSSMSENDKIDIAIMQKLLPKLHGSRRKLLSILEVLASFCVEGKSDVSKSFLNSKEALNFKENSSILYPLSLEKITRMYKGAIDNGFASYAEA